MVRVHKEYGQKTEETDNDRFIDPGAQISRRIDEKHDDDDDYDDDDD